MDYKELIHRLMPLVNSESEIPCVIWKNESKWNLDYINLPKEEAAAYFGEVKEKDPCAIFVSGADFKAGNFIYIYNTVLLERIYAERDNTSIDNENQGKYEATANFLSDYVIILSDDAKEYLARCNRPLAVVNDLLLVSLESNDLEYPYDVKKAEDALGFLNYKIGELAKASRLENHTPSNTNKTDERKGTGMTFDAVITKIMPEVESGSKEPFIIYRDSSGSWHGDFTQNQYGEQYDWVEDIQDPFAITTSGYELAKGSLAYVYDRILNERLRAEYVREFFIDADMDELKALINFVEENIGEFSSEVTDYLTLFDKPLATLYEMTPISLASKDPDYDYDHEKIGVFVDAVEAEVNDRLNNRKKQEVINPAPQAETDLESEKRVIQGYKEIAGIQLNGRLMFIGENKSEEFPYLIGEFKWDNPLGLFESDWAGKTDNFGEAAAKFTELINNNADIIKAEFNNRKKQYGVEPLVLTAENCVPNGLAKDITGELIIIKADVLSPEFRRADYQLQLCTGGFGASPKASGRAVYCKDLFNGKESRFERYDVLGAADLKTLPQWAADRLSELRGQEAPTKNSKLQKRLNNAKKTVKENDQNDGSKPKKRRKKGIE